MRLAFDGGDAVPVSLAGGGHVNMAAYEQISHSLAGKDYRYYVNRTVTPDQCPTELYPLLWNWLD